MTINKQFKKKIIITENEISDTQTKKKKRRN